jgi:dolichol-phosphate mannosyltransferase
MLSVVIPVYDESASLGMLHSELDAVARENGYELEIIFIDDGSTDGSWNTISEIAASDARVRGIRFRRNFGKAAALSAGFEESHGELVVTLDADLQDNPREIPRFLAEIESGLDVVSGWKKVRYDPWHKVVPSRVFNWLVGKLTGVTLHDHNCGMKCYRRAVIREIRLYGELHRFIPVLSAARGFRVGEVVVEHRPRQFGRSKYGMNRFLKGFLDLLTVKFLTGFGQRPLHLLGSIGLFATLLGVVSLACLAGHWVISRMLDSMEDIHLHQRAALYYALALLILGGQMMSVGFLGELITAYLGHQVDTYSIAERTGAISAKAKQSSPSQSNLR